MRGETVESKLLHPGPCAEVRLILWAGIPRAGHLIVPGG